MKKKLIIGFGAFAIAAIAAFNINMNTNSSNLSALSLANIEALANSENTPPKIPCNSMKSSTCRATVQLANGSLTTLEIEDATRA